ncbi:MAG TPA: ABC transporter permease, partial [Blastocatellia bacterium]|nr:ABC transporter permease [Blastocatellia bacterium]
MIHQLEILIQDLRYAGRTTHRSPGFAAVVILSMALGIGANSAIFNLVDTLMLRSLPVKDPQQLVILANDTKWSSFSSPLLQAIIQRTFSYPAYTGFRDSNHVLSGIFAVQDGQRLSARIDGQNEIVTGLFSSASFYSVLGVGTAVGRPMLSDDERPNADTVCVISYGYWERRFGRDPGVLSKTIYLNGKPGTIVGVTLQGFYGLDAASTPPDIAIPITKYDFINDDNRLASRTNGWLQIIGRLRPGIPTQQAIADLDVIYHSIQQEAREESKKPGDAEASEKDFAHIQFQPGARGMSYLGAMYSNSLLVLMAAVGLVLLIACSNVASLLLARATWRQKEMAVRSAIGAGRWRLMRQLLTESVLLAMIGGGLGVIFCFWGSRFLLKFIFTSDEIPRNLQAGSAVLWFALLLSVITGMVFGLAPALRSTRFGLASTLKENSANVAGASKSLLGKTLVVGQVALSLVLLIAAGLLVRSFQRLKSVELGFRPDGVIVAQTDADLLGYKGERLQAFYKNILDKARTIPGAVSATLSEPSPIGGGESVSSFSVPGQPEDANNQTHITQI